MLLDYSYKMELEFSEPVSDQYFSLICLPRETARQKPSEPVISIRPEVHVTLDTDGFGNMKLYGAVFEPHDSFSIKINGKVRTCGSPHEEYEENGSVDLYRWLAPSDFTAAGPGIRKLFAEKAMQSPDDAYGRALYYAGVVRDVLEYRAGVTDSRTSAEEALAKGSGVCQDFAHLYITLLRMAGIPARYTVGLMQGEGESHAWAEANCNGYWYGIDPTNGLLIDESYIKISHGRDYRDCMISRGIFRNPSAVQTMSVAVSVSSLDDSAVSRDNIG